MNANCLGLYGREAQVRCFPAIEERKSLISGVKGALRRAADCMPPDLDPRFAGRPVVHLCPLVAPSSLPLHPLGFQERPLLRLVHLRIAFARRALRRARRGDDRCVIGYNGSIKASSDFQGTTCSISSRNTSRRVFFRLPAYSASPKRIWLIDYPVLFLSDDETKIAETFSDFPWATQGHRLLARSAQARVLRQSQYP
jgi:hypothetical protein